VSNRHAVQLIWLGGLGVVYFGGLWLVVKCLDSGPIKQLDRELLGRILGPSRRRHLDRWVRAAPPLTLVSVGLVIAGTILRLAGSS